MLGSVGRTRLQLETGDLLGRVDLIIFDCDGVLIDSELISCECALSALQSLGLQINLETVMSRFLGTSRREMARQVAEEGYPVSPDFTEILEDAVTKAFEHRLTGMAGIRQALSSITLPCCVASNSPLPYIRRGLGLAGLGDMFQGNLFSASMVEHGKPAPDLFLYAAKAMGVAPEKCLVIEDSLVGVKAANQAHMPVFWFLGGSHIDLHKRPINCESVAFEIQFRAMAELPTLLESYQSCVPNLTSHSVGRAETECMSE